MQQKSPFIMLALSGSILMVMLFTVLGYTPNTTALQADIVGAEVSIVSQQNPTPLSRSNGSVRTPEEILRDIQDRVKNNKPDEAKKFYDELWTTRQLQK